MTTSPLQWQLVNVPLGSMDESADERVLPVGNLTSVKNGQWKKRGRIGKRAGFKRKDIRLSANQADSAIDSARGCFSTGEELCILGRSRLYAHNDKRGRWYDRGQIGPCTGKLDPKFRDQNTYRVGDMDRVGDYVGYAAQVAYQDTFNKSTNEFSIGLVGSVSSRDGQVVIPPWEIVQPASTAANKVDSPRVTRSGAHEDGCLLFMWLEDLSGATASLKYVEWDPATPDTKPSTITTHATDVVRSGENHRVYDACPVSGKLIEDGYIIAYITDTSTATSHEINIQRFNKAGTLRRAATITTDAPYQNIAISLSKSRESVFVIASSDGSGGSNDSLYLWRLGVDTFAVEYGPINLFTLASATEFFGNIGVAEGYAPFHEDANGWALAVTASVRDSGDTSMYTTARTYDSATATTSLSQTVYIYNSTPRTRPWWHDGRPYVWVDSALAYSNSGSYNGAGSPAPTSPIDGTAAAVTAFGNELFEYCAMFDLISVGDELDPADDDTKARFCGYHSGGVGPIADGDVKVTKRGNGANVVDMGDGTWRYMSTSWSYLLDGTDRRYSADEVTLDFSEAPLATVVDSGAAVIGGSFVSWYAGSIVEELGWAAPPIILDDGTDGPQDATITSPATTLTNATYTYLGMWETYDEKGYLHRSVPSPPISYTKSTGNSVKFQAKTIGATNRLELPTRKSAWVLYRAEADAIAKRITPPTRLVENDQAQTTGDQYDYGQPQGPILYTNGGAEIENVMPEGARIPVVVGDRLWLGDFFRRARVQYSKSFTAGTATEDGIAPEFNEGFNLPVPSGSDVSGMARMDDKLLVFTPAEVYALSGRGPNVDGSQNDFSTLTTVSTDAGCSDPRSVVSTPVGVMFMGAAGIYMVGRGLALQFIGAPVEDKTSEYPIITSAVLCPKDTEVRFTATNGDASAGIVIVYNYEEQKWCWWEVKDKDGRVVAPAGACLHGDSYVIVEPNGVTWEQDGSTYWDDEFSYVPLRVETSWFQAAKQSGWQRIKNVVPLMRHKDRHELTMSVLVDFADSESQSKTWTASALESLPRQQLRQRVKRQKSTALKCIIEDSEATGASSGQGYELNGLALEIGIKRGAARVPAEARG